MIKATCLHCEKAYYKHFLKIRFAKHGYVIGRNPDTSKIVHFLLIHRRVAQFIC